eukprot:1816190-Ditylum_brightwellii.AAC.1
MVSPGFIVDIHPGLTRIEDYKKEVDESISNYAPPDNNIVTNWIKKQQKQQTDKPAIMPKFKVVKTTIKWVKNDNRIKTTVLKLLCAKKDGLYFKTLLANAFNSPNKPRGTFVPLKEWLLTSPESC